MKQSPCTKFCKFNLAIEMFIMKKCKSNNSVFYRQTIVGIILLVVYVNDIVITKNDILGILSNLLCIVSFI